MPMRRNFLISVIFFSMTLLCSTGKCEPQFEACRGHSFLHLMLDQVSVWLSACDFEINILTDGLQMNVVPVNRIPGLRTYEVRGNGVIAGHSPNVVIINSPDGLFVNGRSISQDVQNMLIDRDGGIFPHMFYRTYD